MRGGAGAPRGSMSVQDEQQERSKVPIASDFAAAAAAAASPSLLELLKNWLLCGCCFSGSRQFLKPGYMEMMDDAIKMRREEPYVRPSRWTLLVRRCRARLRRGGGGGGAGGGAACWDGGPCFGKPGGNPALHIYKTDSYERNFDRGREYWEDLPIVGHPISADEDWEWGAARNSSAGVPLPDPVWMITASQEEIKQKAAEIVKARRGE